jgi:hypothetical protein
MKYAEPRPLSDPEKAARKLLEIAIAIEVVQDGRTYIETINGQFLFKEGGTPQEYSRRRARTCSHRLAPRRASWRRQREDKTAA